MILNGVSTESQFVSTVVGFSHPTDLDYIDAHDHAAARAVKARPDAAGFRTA
jgi:hypothetical protein